MSEAKWKYERGDIVAPNVARPANAPTYIVDRRLVDTDTGVRMYAVRSLHRHGGADETINAKSIENPRTYVLVNGPEGEGA